MKGQTKRIRNLFIQHQNQWIPLYDIQAIAAQYNARIFGLRREGMNIVNKTKMIHGEKHSWYKYVTVKEENGQLIFT